MAGLIWLVMQVVILVVQAVLHPVPLVGVGLAAVSWLCVFMLRGHGERAAPLDGIEQMVAAWREDYVAGKITLEQFERFVDLVLRRSGSR